MRVLVADDDPTTRTFLKRLLLRDFDCAVTEVEHGLEALAQLDTERYSVLLLDVHMPFMGGIETLRVIRGSAHSSLPVIMLTAERAEAVVREAVALGITDYLVKPLQLNHAGKRLAGVLRDLRAGAAGADADAEHLTLDERLPVLVAEGDPDYRQFLMSFFESRCEALEASSGAEALTLCLRTVPRLVFVGGELGIIDADTLVQKIRAAKALSRARVIATVPESRIAETEAHDVYDLVIARAFEEKLFADQFARLAESTPPPVHPLDDAVSRRPADTDAADRRSSDVTDTADTGVGVEVPGAAGASPDPVASADTPPVPAGTDAG